jgi:hypothetical protein
VVRLSVGIEDVEDIIADLDGALNNPRRSGRAGRICRDAAVPTTRGTRLSFPRKTSSRTTPTRRMFHPDRPVRRLEHAILARSSSVARHQGQQEHAVKGGGPGDQLDEGWVRVGEPPRRKVGKSVPSR